MTNYTVGLKVYCLTLLVVKVKKINVISLSVHFRKIILTDSLYGKMEGEGRKI
jgi:hypothetical protein